jgi:hypothetical protein
MMIKTLTVAAATFIAIGSFSPGAHACDEDCAYEAQEAAHERAYEREAAREEAAEEGYYSGSRRSGSPSASRRKQAVQAQAKRSSEPPAAERQTVEPKPDPTPRTQTGSPRIKVAKENSSISTGSGADRRDVAEDDSYVRPAKAIGCKTYLPSVGMTLSVPCD